MRRMLSATLVLAAAIAGCSGGQGLRLLTLAGNEPVDGPASGKAVTDWNVIALRTTAQAPVDPPRETRSVAMVHAAVYDAVQAITGNYKPLVYKARAPKGASAPAAVASAAHDVLAAFYPAQKAALDSAYETSLAAIPDGAPKQQGVEAGQRAAAAIIAARAGDHADDPVSYTPQPGPGKWQPTPPASRPALDPGWGRVTPFMIGEAAKFGAPPPYALTSAAYSKDFNEIKAVGAAASTTRAEDQTATARFWTVTSAQEWNQPARELATSRRLTLSETARLFAMLNLAEADAAIVAWDTKFTYNQWRPVTGIRGAGSDGNPDTDADLTWTPLLVTPPFPDYVCGHSTLGGAAEATLGFFFGDHPGDLTLTSAALPGVVRHFSSFSAIGDDVTNARVWGGIHWRSSCVIGREAGRKVGHWATSHFLRPAH